MGRYDRQTCLPEVGLVGQATLAAARVLVVGAGGLGAHVLPLLAGAGVGHLRVIDPDVVEESNLHRQTLYRMGDIGQSKSRAAAATLRALNPDCTVEPLVARLDPLNAAAEVASADLVIDAADSFAVSYTLSDQCRAQGKPLISASCLARQGYVVGLCGPAPSLRAVFPDLPPTGQTCASAGVMGPLVGTLGALQAQMALSVLLRHAPTPLGQMLSIDLTTWRVSSFRFDGAPEPDQALPRIVARAETGAGDIVIDLRDPAAPGPETLHPQTTQRVVFVCATGLRAWRAARDLAGRGHPDVAICAEG
ncbi:thiamine biosynthesis protein ThiF [Oceanicola sp. 22II-s10i]|uniref:HesA/MoeB/ThiF family protein n=1 Tax=Oceanicola sp. 22II-s10i TaxID=1317116 RepID=UPI000B522A2A|nr:HesA/MoeB/ThiF family protein [Oceanicola sp. 22II-s10i]OWU84307.1 thiamine biosynthesis protein ThiF [Oceanicola sp. 22II-s10i]